MRIIAFLFILLAVACNSKSKGSHAEIDTAKLFDPKPELNDIGAAEMNEFTNCLALMNPGEITVRHEDKIYVCSGFKELEDSLSKYVNEIIKKKFYIWADANTPFKKIQSAIEAVKKAGIENYRVLNTNKFIPEEPVAIREPKSVTSEKLEDFHGSIITLRDEKITLEYNKQITEFKNLAGFDNYISLNQIRLDSTSVMVKVSGKYMQTGFSKFSEILKKHGVTKFNLVSIID